jgi:hypothetical protein
MHPTECIYRTNRKNRWLARQPAGTCDINDAMVGTRFYFWYYAIPKPLAEEGERSV